jgi:hypothetical protein
METPQKTCLYKRKERACKNAPDGEVLTFKVEDEIQWMQRNSQGKRLVLENEI